LMGSNPAWQTTLVGSSSRTNDIEVTLELCGQFPTDYQTDCIVGAVDNIMNFDGLTLDRALRFCRAVKDLDREVCNRHIGISIRAQVISYERRFLLCQQVDGAYRDWCLEGAGLELVGGQMVAAQDVTSQDVPAPDQITSGTVAETKGESDENGDHRPGITADVNVSEVQYLDDGFSPDSVTIEAGDVVRWVNQGSGLMWPASDVHPTHEEYPGFDAARPISEGGSWSFSFDGVGVWSYHNHMNPNAKGVVIVEE
ncbi:MAG: hypothetical protein IIB17_11710, partial [Chloroflexi bacterium]|nr:hypothetical protein [Chloroflexota bacterium]